MIQVLNKYDGSVLVELPLLSHVELHDLVDKSVKAFTLFKKSSLNKRKEILEKMIASVKEHEEELALDICAEAGKPISYARAEIKRCIFTLELAIDELDSLEAQDSKVKAMGNTSQKLKTKRFPRGPILGIVPFNFPLNLSMHKIAPAIASGCSIVIKPNLLTAHSIVKLVDLWNKFLPKDLIQVALCSDEHSQELVESDHFSNLSFTGSATVGWKLKSLSKKKKVTLELGGDAALIIDKGYDWKKEIDQITNGCFLYAGQICISTQRLYIHESQYESFKKALIDKVKSIVTGDPLKEDCVVGPLISSTHLKRIKNWVQDASSKGAKVLCGGEILNQERNLFPPTILEGVNEEMILGCEEVFGPVVQLYSFQSFEDVIHEVNKSRYGLQTGLMSSSQENIDYAFENLDVGAVILNRVPGYRVDSMPYGGIKDSGLGREGLKWAIEDFTEPKLLVF
ncbi:MAG: aldehyde dehydrogenase family protein [Oligoflexia bacterium]|nr:aldehyde dehydrogenase family protein [Oligoflexia bacterium]